MLGDNREIFFPKLAAETMEGFDRIAVDFIHEHGYEVEYCDSDEAAIRRAKELFEKDSNPDKLYPVHFSGSDTSGEKAYEEFYTEDETVDMDRFSSFGVICQKMQPDRARVGALIDGLEAALDDDSVTKDEIVRIISDYLPNFSHIETGSSLDGKM